MNCTDIMNIRLPENIDVIRLCDILSSGTVPVLCIWKCKAVSSHDPSGSLYIHMNDRIPNECSYSPVAIGCPLCR